MDLKELLNYANLSKRKAAMYSGITRPTMERMDTVGCYYKTVARLALTCGHTVANFKGMRKLSDCELTEIILPQWKVPAPLDLEAAVVRSGLTPEAFCRGIFWPQCISWPERIRVRIAVKGLKWPRALGKKNINILNEVFENE